MHVQYLQLVIRGEIIHTFLHGSQGTRGSHAIILVPGLLETADMPLFIHQAVELQAHGYAVIRFDSPSFYGNPGTVTLENTSVYGQVREIEEIATHFQAQFPHISLVAHSMGAFASLLVSHPAIDRLVLWDPSRHPYDIFSKAVYDHSKETYYDAQLKRNVPRRFMEELSILKARSIEELLSRTHHPIGIISAERGAARIAHHYLNHTRHLLGHVVIGNADHNFSSPFRGELLEMTLSFLEKEKTVS